MRRSLAAGLALLLVSGCETTTRPTAIEFSLGTGAATLVQGQTTAVNAIVSRSNFAGSLTLTTTGLPTGVSASFHPSVLTGSASEVVLTLTATNLATPGTVAVTVVASGSGIDSRSESFELTVLVAGNYTLAAPWTSVIQGQSATATLSIDRSGGFAQKVALSISGLPDGVFAALDPVNATESSIVTFSALVSAPTGTATITVTGTTPGLADQTTTLELSVLPPPSFALSLQQSAVSIAQGQTATVGLTTARTNFAGPITLSASGLPEGISAQFAPSVPSGSESEIVLTLTATNVAEPGTFTVTVSASGNGMDIQSESLELTVAVSGTYTLAAPSSVTVFQGLSAATTLSVTRSTDFAQSVSLSVSGLPAGVTATIDPQDGTAATSTLTFAASPSATIGSATVTVTGVTPGLEDRTTTLSLDVQVPPSIALSLGSPTAIVGQGKSRSVAVSIVRTNFTGDVALSAANLPAGVTATFSPSTLTGDGTSSTLLLEVSGSAALGSVVATVSAAPPGLDARSVDLTLYVTPPTTTITFAFCESPPHRPVWIAQQNEGAPWEQLTLDEAGRLTFEATAKASLGFVSGVSSFDTRFLHATATELAALSASCVALTGFSSVSGTYKVTDPTWTGRVSLPFMSSTHAGGASTLRQYSRDDWIGIPFDVVVSEGVRGEGLADWTPNKLFVLRDVMTSTVPLVDLSSPSAVSPVWSNYSVSGVPEGEVYLSDLRLITNAFGPGNITDAFIWGTTSDATSATFGSVPASMLVAGDVQEFSYTSRVLSSGTEQSRSVLSVMEAASDMILALGPALNVPTVTALMPSGGLRYRVQLASQADYGGMLAFMITQSSGHAFRVEMTSGYLGATPTTWDVSMPEFGTLPGWDSAYGLVPDNRTTIATIASSFAAVSLYSKRRQYPVGATVNSARYSTTGIVP